MKIKLPEVVKIYLKDNHNTVQQLMEPSFEIEAEIEVLNEEINGYIIKTNNGNDNDILVTSSEETVSSRFNKIILTKKNNLTPKEDLTMTKWIKHPKLSLSSTATEVFSSWDKNFIYTEEDITSNKKGLRSPQIGALHAIHAHWTVSNEPATVVMPTGTGKTETMLSVLVSKPCKKVLVIVPTDALRKQIADKFISLGVLKKFGIISDDYICPIVGVLENKPLSIEKLDSFFALCNVVVTTINVAGQLQPTLQNRMVEHCDYLFLDEAHHMPAKTWRDLKEKFLSKKILQFTATPFRNDKQPIDGKIIFKYPLKLAFENKYFKKIHFKPVREYDSNKMDKAICEKAIEQLRQDPTNHILMVRVDTTKRAKEVFPLYHQYQEYNPVQIHTGVSPSERKLAKQALISGQSRIIICVDMLGEGFDLPELKIAAFHDIRKSLAITLQLAGRFTRSREDLGDATFIANIADVNVPGELNKLYRQDADWNFLLEQGSEDVINEELEIRNFRDGFINFPEEIPFQNLQPPTSTVIYKTGDEWRPERFKEGIQGLKSVDKIYHSYNPEKQTLIIITAKKVSIDWIRLADIFNWDWELYVLFWDSEQKLLFIHSSSNSGCYKNLAQAVAGEVAVLINGEQIFRCLAGIKRLLLYNVGLRKQMGRLIKYTMQAGSDVESGLPELQKRNTTKSNIFGSGYENGEKTSVGCSYKGRVWSRKVANIKALTKWFSFIGKKILNDDINPDEILKGTLKPKAVSSRPEKVPIRIDWPEIIYTEPESLFSLIFDRNSTIPIYHSDIRLKNHSESGDLNFELVANDQIVDFSLEIKEVEGGSDYVFKKTGTSIAKISYRSKEKDLTDFFYENPPEIWFSDGSMLSGNTYTELNSNPPTIDENKIDVWDWIGTDIQKESQGVDKNADTIQYKVIQNISKNYDVVINDDGPGEAADVVGIQVVEDTEGHKHIEADLYHCKYSEKPTAGSRITDLYEVCGQAQRSAYWKEDIQKFLSHFLRRGVLRENEKTISRFEKGDDNELDKILRMSEMHVLKMRIFIVQPGISKSKISQEQKKLLGITENYLLETYEIPLKVIVSE